MGSNRGLRQRLLAGMAAGLAGLAAFGIVHWYLLFPTYAVFIEGVPIALLAGTALGWAQHELVRHGAWPFQGAGSAVLGPATLVPAAPAVLVAIATDTGGGLPLTLALGALLPLAIALTVVRAWLGRWRPAIACTAAVAIPSSFTGGALLDGTAGWAAAAPQLAAVLAGALAFGAGLGAMEALAARRMVLPAAVLEDGAGGHGASP